MWRRDEEGLKEEIDEPSKQLPRFFFPKKIFYDSLTALMRLDHERTILVSKLFSVELRPHLSNVNRNNLRNEKRNL